MNRGVLRYIGRSSSGAGLRVNPVLVAQCTPITSRFSEALPKVGVLSLLLVNRKSCVFFFFGKRQLANSCNILNDSINKKARLH